MDPLSAIRMFAGPAAQQNPLAKGAIDAFQKGGGMGGLSKVIPESELSQLRPFAKLGEMQPATDSVQAALPSYGRVAGRDAFADAMGNFVGEVNSKQAAAGDSVRGLIGNQGVSLHQAMIAMEEASVSFQLMVEVRNKLLESYQELMRMQV